MRLWTVILLQSRSGRDSIETREMNGSYTDKNAWIDACESYSSEYSEVLAIIPGGHSENIVTGSKED